MKPLIQWHPSRTVARVLRDVSFLLGIACLAIVPQFRGMSDDQFPALAMPLFIGTFPLFFGAVLILTSRIGSKRVMNWVPYLVEGLPRGAGFAFHVAFFAVWAASMYIMVRPFLDSTLPDFGVSPAAIFVLVPAGFYATCFMAYWSAMKEAEMRMKAAQPGATDNPGDAQRLREDH